MADEHKADGGVVLIRFPATTSKRITEFAKRRIEEGGLVICKEERLAVVGTDTFVVCLSLSAPGSVLEEQAEYQAFIKDTIDGIKDVFSVKARHNYVGVNNSDFFSPAERAQLVIERLKDIPALSCNDQSASDDETVKELGIDGSTDEGDTKLLDVLEEKEYVDVVCPHHDPKARDSLMWDTLAVAWPRRNSSVFSPVDRICDYYGAEVALYFAWVDFMTRWLLIPAIAGVCLYLVRTYYNNDTIDDCELTPYYGLGVFVWAVCLLRYYQQHEARLAWKWGTFNSSVDFGDHTDNVRPGFTGTERLSPITGKTEIHFSRSQRRIRYLFSAVVTVVLLVGAFVVMICSLNLQGYIQPSHDRARWPQDEDHPFYVQLFAQYSVEGGLFDPASNYMSFVPVVLHVAVILGLNAAYSWVAELLTEWENHQTMVAHDNSLIVKRFLWEAFDAYIGLFYLTVYEQDIAKLRAELIAVFTVDTFRRIFVEMMLPRAMQIISAKLTQKKFASGKATNEVTATTRHPLFRESSLQQYESFDDYLEMTIQFGYITLFASAFPLAAYIGAVANLVEVRSDGVKLASVCQRPRPFRKATIGMWFHLMTGIVILSALTNVWIFGFTSQQLMQYIPSWFVIEADGDQGLVDGSGRYVVLLVFVIEHFMLLLGFCVAIYLPSVPEDVVEGQQHRNFVINRAARKLRFQQIERQHSM